MTTATAGNVAGQVEKEKEKVEKRRALGRGLESLLPGPRVLPSGVGRPGVGGPQIASVRSAPVRNDSADPSIAPVSSGGSRQVERYPIEETIRAVVGEAVDAAELRSGGQPGAAVPTQAIPPPTAPPLPPLTPAPSTATAENPATAPVPFSADKIERDESGQPVTMFAMAERGRVPGNLVINVALTDVDKNPFQTRYVEDDEALEELAESIKANGVVQPIVVRPSDEDEARYVLVLGERRLHASKKAGKTHIPALVRKVSLQQAAEMTIVENLQREDLSPLEQAEAFRVLSTKFSMTQQQIAERVGLSRESVSNYMRLLKLPREVMQMLAEKRINFAQARELLKLGENDRIVEAALYAVKKGMNIEQIESLVLRMDGLLDPLPGMPGVQKREKSGGARWVDPNVRSAQMELERMLGVRVRIRDRKGKGKIVIEYATVDDYERVVEMLRGKK